MPPIATQALPAARARLKHLPSLSVGFALRALAALLVVWLAASFIAERTTLHPPRRALGPTPAARGMSYIDISFKTSDGLTLRGWWIPGTREQTVVMVHGLSNNRSEGFDKAGYLHQAGYNLLVFDLRGHGQSDGSGSTMGYREPADVSAAVAEARSFSPGPIALIGYSLGAAVAVEEAAVNPHVTAVVEDSGFSSVGDVFLARFGEVTHLPNTPWAAALVGFAQMDIGTSLWNVQPVAMAARLHKPLLAIVGTEDTIVPPGEGLALFNAATGPKQLLEVRGAGHVQAYDTENELYKRTVLDFLEKSLKP
ncbi:MAG TPA: alpha/beta hydrolase [Candidatus Dormibacteraeota bacterium]|nr:alpha/beta hydrolase [Candidatus Dormibacteraeota bacterium]